MLNYCCYYTGRGPSPVSPLVTAGEERGGADRPKTWWTLEGEGGGESDGGEERDESITNHY
jgi:hypothetical protein